MDFFKKEAGIPGRFGNVFPEEVSSVLTRIREICREQEAVENLKNYMVDGAIDIKLILASS